MSYWWRERIVYQIYPRSFKDTNGDGIGDIPGIISKLDDLKDLGIGIIWLSPVYCSPNEDNGYDISDYRDINPEYGSMKDMDELIIEAGKRDIKIIMDLVINHTSDQHEWFQKSRDKDSEYRDYYFWRPGKKDKLPNNWTSFFAEDCWEYDEKSGEYYLHLFAKGQPDLNFHNPKVLSEIKEIMRFWLDKGIAGFRCDVINIIWKSSLEDGKKKIALTGSEHYLSQEGAHEILKSLRKDVMDDYDCFTVGETVMVTPKMARDLCAKERGELDMVFSFAHMDTDQWFVKWFPRKFNPKRFFKVISKWQDELEWNANYFENHDQPRSVSRFGDDGRYHEKSAKVLAMLLLTLRGTPYIYQGQEIGMTNYPFQGLDEIEDIESHNLIALAKKLHIPKWYRKKMLMRGCRDHARTPVQWDDSDNAGFTKGDPWLVINENYFSINMEEQKNNPGSIRSFYKKLIAFRSENDVLIDGVFKTVEIKKDTFIYKRQHRGKSIVIALNFSGKFHTIDVIGKQLLSNYDTKDFSGTLRPFEGVILEG
ncbi:MAG: alpha-glucosidase [Clostridia bacterium]|nr:alpha-glucosidase [Clostridia bacterium]